MDLKQYLKSAGSVKPTVRQLNWFEKGFYAFIHFTVNTYTNLEWGLGNEDERIFDPYDLNCDEWVEAVKSAGMKGIVLTAKHHDGFCLWPSAYTEHSVKNSPWKNGKGDVVLECAQACARGGIEFGVYLSPWDRNSKYYGTPEYNDYYCNQLTELLTNYGKLFHIWFDNACGEGENGKKQVYDFERYIALIRKYQPEATIYNDYGPDVRWCGNEAGTSRRAEWATVPTELCFRCEAQTGPGPLADAADMSYIRNWDKNIGEISNIMYSKALGFAGAEIDMSIRPGWFYHANEEPHSIERLFETYLNSYGNNACFNLNIPPMPSGRFDPRDIKRLKEFGEAINDAFGDHKKVNYTVTRKDINDTQCEFELSLDERADVRYIELRENISQGQRIESFLIFDGESRIFSGFTVGNRKICPVKSEKNSDHLKILITAARNTVDMREITVYKA
ncbi:MAG: alpha-L-fucosidase [Clostridia bacterium]|nr:alpha-L-fucosidase [Clostridia bacterium]